MTPIAQLVEMLASTGIPPELIARAVDLAQQHADHVRNSSTANITETGADSRRDGRDEAAERRRAADRYRKTKLRSSGDWAEITRKVFARDNFVCTYCGVTDRKLHCDHVIPLSRGGSNDLSNLTTACAKCNVSKGARTPSEWRRQ